jgi:heterodisulfide reductase subunit C
MDKVITNMKANEIYKLKDFESFAKSIINVSGEQINNCYQCKKCTVGCPITFAMDIMPHQIIKYIQLGLEEKILTSKTIWLCAACETCGTRCPNEIKLADMMDALRQRALASKWRSSIGEKGTSAFHKEFLSSIRTNGRVYEAMMMAKSRMKSGRFLSYLQKGEWIADIMLFIPMLLKGKMGILPHRIKERKEVKNIFKKFVMARKV